MVFEDIHWADEGLVAFVEYLLDWGRHHPIFVLTLARPEIADRHPGFPGSTPQCDDDAARAARRRRDGRAAHRPRPRPARRRCARRLRDAADGIPLYAVETVRMLRDRGLLEQVDDEVVITGDLTTIEVPETLHALIASRLDAVREPERRLLQDASVLGKTFTKRGLASLSGLDETEVESLVTSLVRKELLAVEADPFSPERGQLGFLQALVQRVTYETIARRDRRRRHLAAARFLSTEAGIDPDEIAEVIASHYLDAHEADPDADDRDEVRAEARRWFTRAADRAASLAASLEAQRAFVRAAGLAGEEVERGRSLARAGDLAVMGSRLDEAEPLLEEAIGILRAAGARPEAASAEVRLGEVLFVTERIESAVALLEGALAVYESEGDMSAVATVSAELSRFVFFEGRPEDAMPYAELALEHGERLRLAPVVVQALMNKALILKRRPNESLGLMRQALLLAEECGDDRGAMRACMNLSYLLSIAGRNAEAYEIVQRGIALARRRGDRVWESSLLTNLVSELIAQGRWDEAEQAVAEMPDDGGIVTDPVHASTKLDLASLALLRGESARAVELAFPYTAWGDTARVQSRGVGIWARAIVAAAELRFVDAVAECVGALRDEQIALDPAACEVLIEVGCEAAWAARDADGISTILALFDASPVDAAASTEARLALQRARTRSAAAGAGARTFESAVSAFRANGEPYWIATAQLEQAEWLAEHGRGDEAEPLLTEARGTFERLRVTPRLERVERLDALTTAST